MLVVEELELELAEVAPRERDDIEVDDVEGFDSAEEEDEEDLVLLLELEREESEEEADPLPAAELVNEPPELLAPELPQPVPLEPELPEPELPEPDSDAPPDVEGDPCGGSGADAANQGAGSSRLVSGTRSAGPTIGRSRSRS